MSDINKLDIIMGDNFDTSTYERIKLNYDEVKKAIHNCRNQKEMATQLGCGTNKLRKYLNENGLYKEYCDAHNVPYKPQKMLPCEICGNIKNTQTLYGKTYVIKRLQGEAKYFKEYSANYNQDNQLICLKYISQSDKRMHYVEVDLDGNVVTNNVLSKIKERINAS